MAVFQDVGKISGPVSLRLWLTCTSNPSGIAIALCWLTLGDIYFLHRIRLQT